MPISDLNPEQLEVYNKIVAAFFKDPERFEGDCGRLRKILRSIGAKQTRLVYLETLKFVNSGGVMMLPDGSRPRFPGGIFFVLANKVVKAVKAARRAEAEKNNLEQPENKAPKASRRTILHKCKICAFYWRGLTHNELCGPCHKRGIRSISKGYKK